MVSVKYYKLRLILGGLYIALIIILSLVPSSYSPTAGLDPSKHDVLSHFTAYFIMMIWYARIYSARDYPPFGGNFYFSGNRVGVCAGNSGHTGISNHRHDVQLPRRACGVAVSQVPFCSRKLPLIFKKPENVKVLF